MIYRGSSDPFTWQGTDYRPGDTFAVTDADMRALDIMANHGHQFEIVLDGEPVTDGASVVAYLQEHTPPEQEDAPVAGSETTVIMDGHEHETPAAE